MNKFYNIQDPSLNKEQQNAFYTMLSGKSMFLMGPGGVGKSYLIDKFFKQATKIHGYTRVAKTSTSGISALNINGQTIHSWAGIGLGEDSTKDLIKNMLPTKKELWSNVAVIIIDEISMMKPELLDKLYEIGLFYKKEYKPLGSHIPKKNNKQDTSIQYIFVGDPFQLPPVDKEKESGKEPLYFFESKYWNAIVGNRTFRLHTSMRQSDPIFRNILNKIRVGICTGEIERILQSRIGADVSVHGVRPTLMYPVNKKVTDKNTYELDKLKKNGSVSKVFNAVYSTKCFKGSINSILETFRKNCPVEDTIELAVGAQVLFKKNNKDLGVVNGTRAVVVSFDDTGPKVLPVVRLVNGMEIVVEYDKFTYSRKDEFEIIKIQVPLKLAWACSIHSSQGLTLDCVEADIGNNIFEYGQSYVVLSRVRTLEGLSLVHFDKSKIKTSPKILMKYYPELVALTDNVIRMTSAIPDDALDRIIDYIV